MSLAKLKCTPCETGTPPLPREEAERLSHGIPEWKLKDTEIERQFEFKDFGEAMSFVNKVADIANEEGHHPVIWIDYNKVRLWLSTHKIGGLSANDFIFAAKVDEVV